MAGFFAKFAGISKSKQTSVAEGRAKKRVMTKIGRVIHIPDDASDRSLFNLPVQTNGADAFKLALVNISEKLNGLATSMLLTQRKPVLSLSKGLSNDRRVKDRKRRIDHVALPAQRRT